MSDPAETSRDLLALCSLTDGGDRCDWGVIARQAHRERTLDALKEGTVIESSERAHRTGWLIATASPVQWAGAYDRADAELEAAAAHGARMTTVLDDDYPTNLRFIHNLPPFLFYRGALDAHLDARSIAVVGTRSASGEGLSRARRMARRLAELGVSIVSGLARGIDTASHRAALDAGGRTIAVFGTGCQWPVGSAQWRTADVPAGGQQNCPLVASRVAHSSVGQWRHPLSGGGLGEADAVAGGEHDVGVVHEPVDGGVGDGLEHEFVEPGGVQVAGQGDGAFLVGGVDDAVERFGGLSCDRQQAESRSCSRFTTTRTSRLMSYDSC